METKLINPLRAGFKIKPKINVRHLNHRLIHLNFITATHNVTQ